MPVNDQTRRIANLSPEKRALLEKRLKEGTLPTPSGDPIAVIGMGCRFPGGANSPELFWDLLKQGFDAVTQTPLQRWNADTFFDSDPDAPGKANTRWGAYLQDVDKFDPAFFGISPHEASRMDPQQRLLMEVAWEAFEDAGQTLDGLAGSKSGVFIGILNHSSEYYWMQISNLAAVDVYTSTGTAHSIMANRLSYQFNLRGPSLAVDTACSSSLVAAHLAIQSLRNRECDLALAGGVHLVLGPENTVALTKLNMMAPDGQCKTFDSRANGFVRGEGCGLVVLKRFTDALADGDNILAVVRGSAVNQDGRSNGLTAPNGLSQEALLREALKNSGVSPDEITLIENHGTGTALGDPIEVEALSKVIGAMRESGKSCFLGSVKTNIGHLEAAAGIAGMIKAVLCLRHQWIPPLLHFTALNQHICLDNTPFVIPTEGRPWPLGPGGKRFAGVSSFGFGGTNAHIILEEASPRHAATDQPQDASDSTAAQNAVAEPQLLTISAHSREALASLAGSYQKLFVGPASESSHSLADICFSSAARRSHHSYRLAVTGASRRNLYDKLESFLQDKPQGYSFGHISPGAHPGPVFVFSGQGPQWFGMGHVLLKTEPVFRETVEQCDLAWRKLADWSLLEELSAGESESHLSATQFAQPAIFAMQVGLATLFRAWGIVPKAVIGHSVGEVAAAHVASALTLEDAMDVLYHRGRLMQRATGHGRMASIELPLSEIESVLASFSGLSVAAINSPSTTVVSGDPEALAKFLGAMEDRHVICRPLPVNYAFHSFQMDPLRVELTESLRAIRPQANSIPLVSTVTGGFYDGKGIDAEYWWRNVREPVNFAAGIDTLIADGHSIFLEVTPHPVLSAAISLCLSSRGKEGIVTATLRRGQNERASLLTAMGDLYAGGCAIDWHALYRKSAHFVTLPSYPWQRKRFWLEQQPARENGAALTLPAAQTQAPPVNPSGQPEQYNPAALQPRSAGSNVIPRKDRILQTLIPLLQELSGVELAAIQPHLTFVEMGFDSLFLTRVSQVFSKKFNIKISIRQMWEDLNTLDRVASFLDEQSAPEPDPEVTPVGQQASVALSLGAMDVGSQLSGSPASLKDVSAIERLVQEQIKLMNAQLDLLRGLSSNPQHSVPGVTSSALAFAPSKTPTSTTSQFGQRTTPSVAVHGPYKPIVKHVAQDLTESQKTHLEAFIARYTERTQGSKRQTQLNRTRLADPRSVTGFNRLWKEMVYPVVVQRSHGSKMWDIDGNEYVDFTMGFGTNLLGHSPDSVITAIENQLQNGIEVGPQAPLAGKVAELMCDLTGMDRCAFCNTGSEAVLAAIRIARTVTGRDLIVYFKGDYHGIFDEVLQKPSAGSGDTLIPIAPGIPAQPSRNVLILEYDSPGSLEIIRARGSEIAAVIAEPVQSRHPDLQPREFLRQLREITQQSGTALIFDEVITGFRSHPGGVQALFGIRADLATYGKIVGGGMPIGAVCGSRMFMDSLDGGAWQYGDSSMPEVGVTFFAGTYVRHPLALAAAQATLEHLKREGPALQQRLSERMDGVVRELNQFLRDHQVPVHIEHFSSFFWVALESKLQFANLLFFLLRDKGIHIFEGRVFFLSTAHSDADVHHLIRAFKDSISEMISVGFLPGQMGIAEPKAIHEIPVEHIPAVATSSPITVRTIPSASLQPATAARASTGAPMAFGLYFFGNYPAPFTPEKYQTIIAAAKLADEQGFSTIWLPERHFHSVGGFSPNPAVIAAALARETHRIQLRAGSVVLPLHNPIRVAEEWSVVDNLSGGRVGLSIASGWHPNDFVFAPDSYEKRRELCMDGLEIIRKLWSGQSIPVRGGNNNSLNVSLYPLPLQRELPVWLTCVSPGSFEKAGELGVGVLAMLTNQSLDDVAAKIAMYRKSLAEHGHDPARGNVTLLVHTFVAQDRDEAVAKARGPMRAYLRSYLDNSQKRHDALGGSQPLEQQDLEYLLDRSFEDYLKNKILVGSPESCIETVDRIRQTGANEVGCFVDFGVDPESLLAGIPHLAKLRKYCEAAPREAVNPTAYEVVSHLQARTAPLTEAQQGLWLLTQMSPQANRAYMEAMTLQIRGHVNLDLLKKAAQAVVNRHESLRTTIDSSGEFQTIHDSVVLDTSIVDLSSLTAKDRKSTLAAQFADFEGRTFDLSQGPLIAARVLRLAEEHHLLVLMFHHIFGNGPSYEVFVKDLCDIYAGLLDGRATELEPTMQLTDYVRWREQQTTAPLSEQDRNFWLRQFPASLPVLNLPADRPRPAVLNYRGGRQSLTIDRSLTAALRTASKDLRTSLFLTLFAGFNVLLHRLSGQEDFLVGVPFEGEVRTLPGGSNLFANTTNMLPLRTHPAQDMPFVDFLTATKSAVFDASEHQSYFFGRLGRDLRLPPDASRMPIITTSFNLDSSGGLRRSCGDLHFELLMDGVPFSNPEDASKFELNVNIVDRGDDLRIDCDYSAELFEASTVGRWLRCYLTLLQNIVSNPSELLGRIPILTAPEIEDAISRWNQTATNRPNGETLLECFDEQTRKAPEALAVTFEDRHLTYSELNRRANQLARHLRKLGVGHDVLVGLFVERSLDMVVGLFGILKAGGAYVPIDPEYPSERAEFMLQDSGVGVVLTQRDLVEQLPKWEGKVLQLDEDWETIAKEDAGKLDNIVSSTDLAYTIYTSGSTGRPKGVRIEHRSLLNLLLSMQREPGLSRDDVMVGVTTLSFDIAGLEIYLPLISGARLVVANRWVVRDASQLASLLGQSGATVMQATPSTWGLLIEAGWDGSPELKVLCGGEAMPPELARKLTQRSRSVWNVYGPTETTIWSSVYRLTGHEKGAIPIGHPIANTQIHVLDAHLNPLPINVSGEIYIGGEGLARGYLNRPELTAEKFVPDPFAAAPGERLYRTGDLGRRLADGGIECLGRLDHQVKLRGFRIELGEIEAVLARHPSIKQSVVIAREDAPGDKRLVAYIVPASSGLSVDEVRDFLKTRLPDYMMPAHYAFLEALPLTPNGKVDRLALPQPDASQSRPTTQYVAPRNPVEETLVGLWSEVLGVTLVGVHDNFFDLGGDSILNIRIMFRATRLGLRLSPKDVFQFPTIAELATLSAGNGSTPTIAAGESTESAPSRESAPNATQFPDSGLSQKQLDELIKEIG